MSPPPPLSPALQGLSFDKKETSHQVVTVCRSRGGPDRGAGCAGRVERRSGLHQVKITEVGGRWVDKGKQTQGQSEPEWRAVCMAGLLRWGQGYWVRSGQQGPDLGRLVIPGGEGSC